MPFPSHFKTHEEYIEWYRNYRKKNRDKIREYNRKYEIERRGSKEYKILHDSPKKRRAYKLVYYAVKNGFLKRKRCEVCNKFPSFAHHKDYNKPLEVKWLCRIHHSLIHNKIDKRKPK